MKSLPIIETNRLLLRQLTVEDSPAVYSYFSQDRVMKYYDLAPFTLLSEAEQIIKTWNTRLQKGEGYRWGITLKDDNKVIGTCGFHSISTEHNRAEIGYELHPDYWGEGIITEACKALIHYGFNQLKYHRIEAFIDPEHAASRKVLQKSGMQTEGILRDYFFEKGRFVDAEILSILNDQEML